MHVYFIVNGDILLKQLQGASSFLFFIFFYVVEIETKHSILELGSLKKDGLLL
jgi:hypothetical protein